ncbi:5-formyltetrahydrofolate cyclo-ligase [Pseudoruegeria sp. SK021]|uniref:5-formyltetrahydrofolate cyclo-ligase n=1 Tax=Pseudoruegeria sp. SK021 TaxID=1933035 RepID=UPI000A21F9FA|nr:5-formyltetrahydrofolate cyclo-ligase [Pseudoruegeria sp. SK021]OSP54034.1 5-formyltetrahydrofolate cyclo-ligase [Pseudoruegeria sp. SK021]
MTDLLSKKMAARQAAVVRRAAAHAGIDQTGAHRHLWAFLAPYAGQALAGYMPIRTEIDPLRVMTGWAAEASVCVPQIVGADQPLQFLRWQPGAEMTQGAFNVPTPAEAAPLLPAVVIVPLLAFGPNGARLGYGKGHYDRTLAALRTQHPVLAVGFAFADQFDSDLPQEATDQPLDAVITERGIAFQAAP